MSPLLLQTITSFCVTLTAIYLLARVAPSIGIVDRPDGRKRHRGEVPLVGGLAIFTSLCVGAVLWGVENETMILVNGNDALWVFMLGGAVLVVTGTLDDRFHLGVFLRVLSEVAAAIIIIEGLDLRVGALGDLLGTGVIRLAPEVAYPFTVIAIFGVINAFNMLDGMDGELAGLVLFSMATFYLFTGTAPGFVSLFVGTSLLAFLVSNLKLTPIVPKTFLGDAGSKLLGFIMVCLILAASSQQIGGVKLINPVTALFVVALPLFDMTYTTLRRVIRGENPVRADRTHIHHLLNDLGFSPRRSLVIILFIALSLQMLGLMLHRAQASEFHQLAIFLGCFVFYSFISNQSWLIARRLQTSVNALNVSFQDTIPINEEAEIKHWSRSSVSSKKHK
ncbi:undecaprenyl-phosphate alpha-N-acetylglucosaminyl 1-phosphatetransferase [Luminiphilus syltensis NOR5-1B]|uniref:Undecaprenyl-phosphate alpha-N-acetylglucosaminyl 1-phosphatetransferase n=1 Tax=Luminiphilus syltensis NOR5-1B TaxID=565045 RepID=B8KVY7_9GAMM|nr:undecaprenyl-phosphate alpha-N-acetylglucosaminyl 1-phosphate transferase [Luminiphilus syltensis]EED35689.1 undecaprenyl-phosphate alpha-N-acetylglucosaminyl 1-phosphatetransferase [Luminiphilus syltensis NOR5-1B]